MAAILTPRYYGRGGQTGELEIFGEKPQRLPTFTCNHCGKPKIVKPHTAPESYCPVCDKIICKECHGKGGCSTWEKQMEQMEARDRLYRSLHAI